MLKKGMAMENTFYVSLTMKAAADCLNTEIVDGSISGELLDDYTINYENGHMSRILLFEKYYYRVGNRLTLTVVLDNADGKTRIHSVSGGGGNGALFSFDWGASESFADAAINALEEYKID
jgi:hypothetical protein